MFLKINLHPITFFSYFLQFRRSVSDLLLRPEHDDFFLLRWLRARQWNSENAEKMLRDHFIWRSKWDVDQIDSWDAPEVFAKTFPHGKLCYIIAFKIFLRIF